VHPPRRLKLGVVCDQFFDQTLGPMGGFGWAARQVAWLFNAHPEFGVDVVFLTGALWGNGLKETMTNGTRLMFRDKLRLDYWRRLKAERIDLLLTVDYRPDYQHLFWLLPRTPIVLWVNDPRPPEDVAKVNTLRIPGEVALPLGISPIDCSSFSLVVQLSRWAARRVVYASPAPKYLLTKSPGTYGVPIDDMKSLCYVMDQEPLDGPPRKHDRPRVIFLGRLDPIKRPWIFTEVARACPDVEFVLMGQNHFHGPGAWMPHSLPSNVQLAGHIEGVRKRELVSSAWALINTSIHEALPVSFVEALRCEVPILSCQDPEDVTSNFGCYVGRWDGDGMDSVPRFEEGLRWLLGDDERRRRLGREGRRWAEESHSHDKFLAGLFDCCEAAGVEVPAACLKARESALARAMITSTPRR